MYLRTCQAKDIIMGPEGSTVVLGVHREARGPQEMGSGPGDFFEVTLVRAAHVAGMRDQNVAPIGIKVLRHCCDVSLVVITCCSL